MELAKLLYLYFIFVDVMYFFLIMLLTPPLQPNVSSAGSLY